MPFAVIVITPENDLTYYEGYSRIQAYKMLKQAREDHPNCHARVEIGRNKQVVSIESLVAA